MGWVDLLTACGDGRINLNTAPRSVLETLPISEQAVDQIVAYRSFDGGSFGRLEDHVFRSATDIEQLQGLKDSDRNVLIALVGFKSVHFRVFVQALHLPTGLRHDVQVLVRMTGDGPEILQWKVGS